MKEPVLTIENLHYCYGNGQEALKGINVKICEGERIAVVGSNGAGKSTFFLNTNGVLTPDEGVIRYRGTTINKKNLKELRKHVGIVFQDADSQIVASTVLAEVGFGPMNLKLSKEEVLERVEEALSYMNIRDYKDRAPHYLSGGEKKRVTIADIIAMRPEIIIFDEPTAGLDPQNADMLEEVLEKLSAEGKTILISTHDVDFAYRWADRIIVFNQGEIIADGVPSEIFRDSNLLAQANLKRPTIMALYNALLRKGIIPVGQICPRSVLEFEKLIEEVL